MAVAILDRVETKSGYIEGVASTPATDSHGHRIMPRAFDASIRRKGLGGSSGVLLLAAHGGNPIGKITRLETIRDELQIAAELNLDIPSVRDLHSSILHNGGLSFSVGFALGEHQFIDPPALDGAWLKILTGDLMEVSVVCFPSQSQAVLNVAKSLSQSRALADWDAFVSRADASNAAIMSKVVEIRRALHKRDRDEETLRQWRHEYVDGPRGRLNI
jgi:HK97 family phage prohead protease